MRGEGANTGAGGDELSDSVMAGVAVGTIALCAIIGACATVFYRRWRRTVKHNEAVATMRAHKRGRGARDAASLFDAALSKAQGSFAAQYQYLSRKSALFDPSTLVIPSSRLTVRSNSSSNSTKKIQAPGILGKGAFTVVLKGTFTPSSTATATTMGLVAGANDETSAGSKSKQPKGQKGSKPKHAQVAVAVQQLTDEHCMQFEPVMAQLKEAILLNSLHHPNVLRTLGLVRDELPYQLVLEYCEHGRLDHFLRKCRPTLDNPIMSLSPDQLCKIAFDVAEAMVYLQTQHIVHCNLAASSVLMTSNTTAGNAGIGQAKVYNFGASQDIYVSGAYLSKNAAAQAASPNTHQTVHRTAPEAIKDGVFTHASDVWSFTMLLYEVFTLGRTPLGVLKPHEVVEELNKENFKLERPEACPEALYMLMCLAWRHNPKARPKFTVFQEYLALAQHPEKLALVTAWNQANQTNEIQSAASKSYSTVGKLPKTAMQVPSSAGVYAVAGEAKTTVHNPSFQHTPDDGAESALAKISVPRACLQTVRRLGEGEFGTVDMCVASSGSIMQDRPLIVAVKFLKATDEEDVSSFVKEATIMTKLQHANLVSILGVCMTEQPYLMVLEYLAGGPLDQWLDLHKATLQLEDRAWILHQAASGASALHQAGIVHRDIAARNVLIGTGLMVKLADFGLSRDLSQGSRDPEYEPYYRMQGHSHLPLRSLAPEVLLNNFKFTAACDVFSFGAWRAVFSIEHA